MRFPAKSSIRPGSPLAVVVLGCGAVTRVYYTPSLKRLSKDGVVRVVGVFDPDEGAMHRICSELPGVIPAATPTELFRRGADIAIIASPPRFHAQQTIAALQAGMHVLCEKPIATSIDDADTMIAAAGAAARYLMVNLVRRQLPTAKLIRELLANGVIGRLRSIDCFEGGPFAWQVHSASYFDRSEAGGGVLQDIGSHCLDLLTWWLGPPASLRYEDDSMGGVEANCLVQLSFSTCTARIRLSRDWARPNIYRFDGDRGWLVWAVNDPDILELGMAGLSVDALLKLRNGAEGRSGSFEDCFTLQIAEIASAIRDGRPPAVSARAGRDVLALIEQCYRLRRPSVLPWLSPGEQGRAASLAGGKP
jgi:predicted dehydrogenase